MLSNGFFLHGPEEVSRRKSPECINGNNVLDPPPSKSVWNFRPLLCDAPSCLVTNELSAKYGCECQMWFLHPRLNLIFVSARHRSCPCCWAAGCCWSKLDTSNQLGKKLAYRLAV